MSDRGLRSAEGLTRLGWVNDLGGGGQQGTLFQDAGGALYITNQGKFTWDQYDNWVTGEGALVERASDFYSRPGQLQNSLQGAAVATAQARASSGDGAIGSFFKGVENSGFGIAPLLLAGAVGGAIALAGPVAAGADTLTISSVGDAAISYGVAPIAQLPAVELLPEVAAPGIGEIATAAGADELVGAGILSPGVVAENAAAGFAIAPAGAAIAGAGAIAGADELVGAGILSPGVVAENAAAGFALTPAGAALTGAAAGAATGITLSQVATGAKIASSVAGTGASLARIATGAGGAAAPGASGAAAPTKATSGVIAAEPDSLAPVAAPGADWAPLLWISAAVVAVLYIFKG